MESEDESRSKGIGLEADCNPEESAAPTSEESAAPTSEKGDEEKFLRECLKCEVDGGAKGSNLSISESVDESEPWWKSIDHEYYNSAGEKVKSNSEESSFEDPLWDDVGWDLNPVRDENLMSVTQNGSTSVSIGSSNPIGNVSNSFCIVVGGHILGFRFSNKLKEEVLGQIFENFLNTNGFGWRNLKKLVYDVMVGNPYKKITSHTCGDELYRVEIHATETDGELTTNILINTNGDEFKPGEVPGEVGELVQVPKYDFVKFKTLFDIVKKDYPDIYNCKILYSPDHRCASVNLFNKIGKEYLLFPNIFITFCYGYPVKKISREGAGEIDF